MDSCYNPECGLIWWIFHVHLKRIKVLQLFGGMFYKCQLCQDIENIGTLYLYWFSIFFSIIIKRNIEWSNYNCGFLISFFSISILFHVFWSSVIKSIHIWYFFLYWINLFLLLLNVLFYPCVILYSEICFFWYQYSLLSFLFIRVSNIYIPLTFTYLQIYI